MAADVGEQARAELATLGPFFAVEPADPSVVWRPVADLVHGPGLAERVERALDALGRRGTAALDRRAAASTAAMSLFARLLSPVVGASLLGCAAPRPEALLWWSRPGGPLPLAAQEWGAPDVAGALEQLVEPLVARLAAEHSLSARVVRGNAASSLFGAATMVVRSRPGLRGRADALLDDALALPLIAGTAVQGRPFVRRSCCLYYRLPGGGLCGDCILAHPPRRPAER